MQISRKIQAVQIFKKANTSYYKRKRDDANMLHKTLKDIVKVSEKLKENIDKENDS